MTEEDYKRAQKIKYDIGVIDRVLEDYVSDKKPSLSDDHLDVYVTEAFKLVPEIGYILGERRKQLTEEFGRL